MSPRWRRISLVIVFVCFVSGVWYRWTIRTGCISYHNYKRIQVGMSRVEVIQLLGLSGEVVEANQIPIVPNYAIPPGSPAGWSGAVWGDSYVRWYDGQQKIYIGLVEGRVVNKWYWQLSL